MNKFTKKFRGVTLTEALLWMGLAAGAILMAFAVYNNAQGSSKMNEARVQLQAYVAGVQQLYTTMNNYSTVTTAVVVQANLAPAQAVEGNTLINPWGGSTTVTGATRNFTITFAAVPQDACVAMLSSGLLNSGTIYAMAANGGTQYTTEINPATAVTACSNGDNNSIAFLAR